MTTLPHRVRWIFLLCAVGGTLALALMSAGWSSSASAQGTVPPPPPSGTGITGIVTISGNVPLAGVVVQAFWQNTAGGWLPFASTTTDAAGRYLLDLAPGQYRVYFNDLSQSYRNEYYNNSYTLPGAAIVTVAQGTITPNINANLEPPAPPVAQVDPGAASVTFDRITGQINVAVSNAHLSPFTITVNLTCSVGAPLSPTLILDTGTVSRTFSLNETPPNSRMYRGVIPATEVANGTLWTRHTCAAAGVQAREASGLSALAETQIGTLNVFTPLGMAVSRGWGQADRPIGNASVLLYKVADWSPRASPTDSLTNTCESNSSRQGQPWTASAPITLGVLVNRDLWAANGWAQEITPTINPVNTDAFGGFGWELARGCWYVVVMADGYPPATSPMFGVTTPVTDVVVALTRRVLLLPFVVRIAR